MDFPAFIGPRFDPGSVGWQLTEPMTVATAAAPARANG
jgi:hypothetical protein